MSGKERKNAILDSFADAVLGADYGNDIEESIYTAYVQTILLTEIKQLRKELNKPQSSNTAKRYSSEVN